MLSIRLCIERLKKCFLLSQIIFSMDCWGNGVLEDIENKYCLKMSLFSGNSSKWLESVVIILYIIHYLKDR